MTDEEKNDTSWIDDLPEYPGIPEGDRRIAIMIKRDKAEEEDADEEPESD